MSVSPGSIQAGFRFLAWLFPAERLEKVTALSLEELQKKYKSRDRWGNFIGFLVFAGLAVGYYFLLYYVANWYYRNLSRAAFLLRPSAVEWGVFAGFLSLTSSTFIGLLIFRRVVGPDEYTIYLAYANHKAHPPAPYDITKVFRLFFWFGFLPLFLLVVLRIDNYTAFFDKSIVDNPFWSLGREVERPYTDVRAVYEVRGYHARFEDKVAPYQLIVFTDGQRWETSHGSGGLKLEHQREIARYVAERSGQKIRVVNFAEDIPP